MGCGRVGSALAQILDSDGHSVAVIDQDASAWKRLARGFSGLTVNGVGFDRERMLEAGIDRADAFVAVSNGDNSNIIAARVAREVFNVGNVIARIYDPRRAEVYERLGIRTVATVAWTVDQIVHRVRADLAHSEWRDPAGTVTLSQMSAAASWLGRSVAEIERNLPGRIAFIQRFGSGLVPDANTALQEGDVLYVAVAVADVDAATEHLNRGPEAHA
jgi:trk system potassium uptake protein TrkA